MSHNIQYNKLDDTQKQVDTVINIMKDNMEKVIQRDEKLTEIESRSEDLQEGSKRFHKVSIKLKHKMWCKNMKFIMLVVAVILIFILIIIMIVLINMKK